jgi:hypothetical protein
VPDQYLGAKIKKWTIEDTENPGKTRWAISLDMYIKQVIGDLKMELELVGQRLATKMSTRCLREIVRRVAQCNF